MSDANEQTQSEKLSGHTADVVHWMTKKRVTPFLGAGVNLADRPPGGSFEKGKCLPNGGELARSLAEKFDYPFHDKDNLLRVSWYATFRKDQAALYDYLQEVFAHTFESTCVHQFLAMLPRRLAAHNYPNCYQTIVTTNYDDVLERAFDTQDEEYDVLYFQAEGEHAGLFYHVPYTQEPRVISKPQEYTDLPIDLGRGNTRTVIVKIHGALSRIDSESSSFVVTEDDYIDYLARVKMQQPLPKVLEAELQKTRFLFMGYSLKDWNMRVFLRRIFQGRKLRTKSWAIMHEAEELEEYFWRSNDVTVLKLSLKDYIAKLDSQIETLPRNLP